jgi:hypothetical protein
MTPSLEVARALERIAEIHGHLDRGEVYRGYHPRLVALTGVLGLAAAAAQPWLLPSPENGAFVVYWIGVAAANLLVHWITMVFGYIKEDEVGRRRTRRGPTPTASAQGRPSDPSQQHTCSVAMAPSPRQPFPQRRRSSPFGAHPRASFKGAIGKPRHHGVADL